MKRVVRRLNHDTQCEVNEGVGTNLVRMRLVPTFFSAWKHLGYVLNLSVFISLKNCIK